MTGLTWSSFQLVIGKMITAPVMSKDKGQLKGGRDCIEHIKIVLSFKLFLSPHK
jgi:hypothetical protein